MAQTRYIEKVFSHGSGKGLVIERGEHEFTTGDTTAILSTTIKRLLYGSVQHMSAAHGTGSHLDIMFFQTASVSNARTVEVRRNDNGRSGMSYWYELTGY